MQIPVLVGILIFSFIAVGAAGYAGFQKISHTKSDDKVVESGDVVINQPLSSTSSQIAVSASTTPVIPKTVSVSNEVGESVNAPVSKIASPSEKPTQPVAVTQPQTEPAAEPKTVPQGTFCNSKYWAACPVGQSFVCPSSGDAYCMSPQENPSATTASKGTLCNGKYWSACPSGQQFVCPSSGDALCELPQSPQSNTSASSQSSEITSAEVNAYTAGVAEIGCGGGANRKTGSASLWKFSNNNYAALTNLHVVTGDGFCTMTLDGGAYDLDKSQSHAWNDFTDISVLNFAVNPVAAEISKPVSNLDYSISLLQKCPANMPLGSPVVVIGYPASTQTTVTYNGHTGRMSSRTVTNGVISALDSSVRKPLGNLPYANYYVSAKIDSGNSGGVALSKTSSGLCLLGVPTWLNIGHYDAQGLVQNIHNVLYTP